MYRILIVEDDNKIASILKETLEKYGYDVVRSTKFEDIKSDFLKTDPQLVLMDVNLPKFDGFYWTRQIRSISKVPIIFISARVGDMDQVMAIENGGDDYITKPFHLDVVLAKIKSVLRRTYGEYAVQSKSSDEWDLEGLHLDRSKNMLEWKNKKTELTKNECLLLDTLARKIDQIVSREDLLEALWDDIDFVDDNTLTVNVTRVRKKLEDIGITKAIETVRGQGYRLRVSWKEQEGQ